MKLVRVALAVPLMRLFDYWLPLDCCAVIGARVIVPFGHQQRLGIILEFPASTDIAEAQLKPIISVLDQQPIFPAPLFKLLQWAAKYYHSPLGEVLSHALPVKLRQGESTVEKPIFFYQISEAGKQALQQDLLKRAPKQRQLLEQLVYPQVKESLVAYANILRTLKEKSYIEESSQQPSQLSWRQQLGSTPIANTNDRLRLNKQQALVFSQLHFKTGFQAWLLEGVTGSGKTEIYLQFIEEILNNGNQVLVLVPEIGLTPQTEQRFRARFNVAIDVLHSNLNDSQRLQIWQRCSTQQSAIVIGTRSALFSPFAKLGLIILDEEHDLSFKQQDGWRYHARDLAVMYAKKLNIPVLMGSATPSLESLYNVQIGKYQHLQLSQRAGNSLSLQQQLIDLKHQQVENGISRHLLSQMKQHLQRGNQVMLFLNRRGFAPALLCHECGWVCSCHHCDKPFTYHQNSQILRCHYCHGQRTVPRQCSQCGSTHLQTTGLGTEQLEENIRKYFPQYQVSRIDRDSTARKGSLERHLQEIQLGKRQILIGTQMLAKGHHFPNITLVALVNVDSALFSIDFRAEERLAQLYVQVAGRAGRAQQQGEVLLQTHYPEHPLLQTLLQQGYSSFAIQALQLRQQMGLPPFSAQALFHARSRNNEKAQQLLQKLADFFQENFPPSSGLQLVGPIPAAHNKKAGQFRWQLLLQHQSRAQLQFALNYFQQHGALLVDDKGWSLDVDPVEFG